MDNMLERSLINLYELSAEKKALIKEMLELTKQQTSCIEANDMDQLGKLINDKQMRIDRIDVIDSEFGDSFRIIKEEYKVDKMEDLAEYDAANVRKLQGCIAEIMDIISDIIEAEKVNNEKVKILKDDMAANIKKVKQGKLINSAYTSSKRMQPSQIYDNKG